MVNKKKSLLVYPVMMIGLFGNTKIAYGCETAGGAAPSVASVSNSSQRKTEGCLLNKFSYEELNEKLVDAHNRNLNVLGDRYEESLSHIDDAIRKYNNSALTSEVGVSPSYLKGLSTNFGGYSAANWNYVMLQEYMKAESIYGRLGFINEENGLSDEQKVKNRAQFSVDNALNCYSGLRNYKSQLERASRDMISYFLSANGAYNKVAMEVSKVKARVSANEKTYKNGDYDRVSTYNNARIFGQEGELKRHNDNIELEVKMSSGFDKTNGDYEFKKDVAQMHHKDNKFVQQNIKKKGNVKDGTHCNTKRTHIQSDWGDTIITERDAVENVAQLNCKKVSQQKEAYNNGKKDYNAFVINEYYTDVLTKYRYGLNIQELSSIIQNSKFNSNKDFEKLNLISMVLKAKKNETDMDELSNKSAHKLCYTNDEQEMIQIKHEMNIFAAQKRINAHNLMQKLLYSLITERFGINNNSDLAILNNLLKYVISEKLVCYDDPSKYMNEHLTKIAYKREISCLYDLLMMNTDVPMRQVLLSACNAEMSLHLIPEASLREDLEKAEAAKQPTLKPSNTTKPMPTMNYNYNNYAPMPTMNYNYNNQPNMWYNNANARTFATISAMNMNFGF